MSIDNLQNREVIYQSLHKEKPSQNVKYREVLENTGMKTSHYLSSVVGGWIMMFNTTFNNISVISWWLLFFLVEETGVPGEKQRLAASH